MKNHHTVAIDMHDAFRDRLGVAMKIKMKADGLKFKDLSVMLEMTQSALNQISQGSAGVDRQCPNLWKHFQVIGWLDLPLADFCKRESGPLTTFLDVCDAIDGLGVTIGKKAMLREVMTSVLSWAQRESWLK